MKRERNRQIDQVFQAALACDTAVRAAFLDEACINDPGLRRDVEALLASDEQAGGFIESPALEIAPELIADDPNTSVTGETIGPYGIDSRLGAGGMGKVYLAHDQRLGRKVALKLLDPVLTSDSEQRARFLREARLAASLDHPNICTIHEVGEVSGRLYIAMQYVEGETLRRAVGGRPLKIDSLLSISLQVADALAEAHARGIIHRDIKPGNIIITPRGQAKVLDFGLAKLLEREGREAETHLTMTGAVMGTPASMSPEQARGERADHRSDIFSFGCVLYEMATGHPPFIGRSKADVISALLTQPHTPAADVNNEIPGRLSAVIDRALAKEPAERYQSMQEMIADFRQVVAEAGGMDHLFSSSAARVGLATPYIRPRRRSPVRRLWVITLLAAVMSLVIFGSYLWSKSTMPPAPPHQSLISPDARPAPIKSIAVLPFKPLVTESRDESLELGMADTLITRLSSISQINVRPTSAVRQYIALDQDAVAAGRRLQVESVLEGSIQREGDRIRVTVRLLDVADGKTLWADQFDEKLTNVFAVQDSISERVAGALALELTGKERELLIRRYTENAEAYRLYLKGSYFWNKRTEESLKQATGYFKQAIDLDPNYALAYAGIAASYELLGALGSISAKEAMPKAKTAAIKALEIDDTRAEAYSVLARIKLNYNWDWSGAEKDFRRAIKLNPNYATGHHWYAWYLAAVERHPEAIAEMKRAQELDPLSLVINTDVGWIFYYARQYDQAIAELRKTLEMDPNFVRAHLRLGLSYLQESMNGEAIETLRKASRLSEGSTEIVAFLGYAYAVSGMKGEARKILNDLKERSRRRYVSPYYIAALYTGLGDKDQAFVWLEKAYEERSGWLVNLEVEPMFDSLRPDARFAALRRRVGLTL